MAVRSCRLVEQSIVCCSALKISFVVINHKSFRQSLLKYIRTNGYLFVTLGKRALGRNKMYFCYNAISLCYFPNSEFHL